MKLNRLLQRQVRKALGGLENVSPDYYPLLEAISKSYDHHAEDRNLMERAMDISSNELQEAFSRLRVDADIQNQIFQKLKSALRNLLSLNIGASNVQINDEADIQEVIRLLELQTNRIKEVEDELLQVQHFINQSNEAIYVVNVEGDIVFANNKAKNWFIRIEETEEVKSVDQVDPNFSSLEEWTILSSSLQDQESLLFFGELEIEEAEKVPIEVNYKKIKVNNIPYIIGVARDITERKIGEEAQQNLIFQLEDVNKELTNFAYVVSHDLKAPLRGIGSITDWLITDYTDVIDNEGQHHLSLLKRRVTRMHNLIEGILAYSRVGRMENKQVPVDLDELLKEVVDSLVISENVDVQILKKFPVILNDKTRMTQVFQNLVGNAIKYNDKENCKVVVDFEDRIGYWKFSINDNGPGIEEKYHEKIFGIFQTLQSKDKIESTGVGLTVVKKIIEHNKGRIWLESSVGEGTKFFFTLPKK